MAKDPARPGTLVRVHLDERERVRVGRFIASLRRELSLNAEDFITRCRLGMTVRQYYAYESGGALDYTAILSRIGLYGQRGS